MRNTAENTTKSFNQQLIENASLSRLKRKIILSAWSTLL